MKRSTRGGPRFVVALARQLTRPIQLAVPFAIAVLVVGQRYGFVADRPAWYYAALMVAITITTSVVDVLWPDKTCTKRQMVYRTSTMLVAITLGIYATGWGPTLAVAYGYAVAYAIRYAGSTATRPMMITSAACILAGQIAIATGIAPTLIPQPLVHGLALLIVSATAMTIWFQGFVIAEREELERLVHEQKEELAHRAYHDSLTQLPNRTAFLEHLESALDDAVADDNLVAVLFIDVDSFKAVNDTLGHGAGDRLLDEFARRIGATVRPSDVVARFGGDEFTVLLRDLGDRAEAAQIAARIAEAVEAPIRLGGQDLVVSASIGVATTGDKNTDIDELLRDADLSMYVTKERRRASSRTFDRV